MIVHLISDRRRLAPSAVEWERARACLLAQARFAIDAGIDVFQVRERDLEAAQLAALVTELVGLSRATRTRIVVNDRLDVALACGADGVHLRGDSVAADRVRAVVPPGFLVGRSVHSVHEAHAASNVDYLIAGAVWETASKPEGAPLLGIAGFREIASAVKLPTLAIGGVTMDRVKEVADAGGAGIAAIGLFLDAELAEPCRAVALSGSVADLRRRFES